MRQAGSSRANQPRRPALRGCGSINRLACGVAGRSRAVMTDTTPCRAAFRPDPHLMIGPAAAVPVSLASLSLPSLSLASFSLASLFFASPVLAQDTRGGAGAVTTLPAVTVTDRAPARSAVDEPSSTGSRLGLTPLQTPASIEVLRGQTIRERGDVSVIEAVSRATGLTMSPAPGNGGSGLGARGFVGHNSVMQLYDGTRLYVGAGTVTFPFDTWMAERIEVLRGAASVMYGEGAIGAAVNMVPKRPTRGPIQNEARLAFGSDRTGHLAFGSGGAIDDRWSYRLDLSHRRGDGYVARGDWDSTAFAGAIRLDVSSQLNLTLSHDQGHQKLMPYLGTPLVNGRLDDRNKRENYNVADARDRFRDRWTRLEAEWTPTDRLRIRNQLYSLTSRRHWRNTESYSYDASTGLVDRDDYLQIGHRQEQVGNRFDATWKDRLAGFDNTLTAGFDVNRIRFQHINDSPYGGFSTVPLTGFDPGRYESPTVYSPRYQTRTTTYALFVEDRFEIDERWSLVGGLRRDHAKVERSDLVNAANGFDKTFNYTTGRLGVVYALSPTQSAYVQLARAVDPLAGLISTNATQAQFDVSTGRQLEIGYKELLANQRGAWSVAVYDIAKKKLLSRSEDNPALVQQIGKQSSRGIEGTLDLQVLPTVRIEANAALLRARYDDFKEMAGGALVSRDGNTPTATPEKMANLWVDWRFLPRWQALAGVRYVGPREANAANTRQVGSYTLVDALLYWDVRRDLRLGLEVANLFDRDYALTFSNGGDQWLLGRPRTVMLSADLRF